MKFKIARAKPSDVPELLKLIRELARFEKLEHQFTLTPARLRCLLFGPRAAGGALVARVSKEAVGYAIYFSTFSSFSGQPGLWLEDLYVSPNFRRSGIGKALIRAVAQIAVRKKCGRFEWSALNWNHNALDFYRSLGGKPLNEWTIIRMEGKAIHRLAARGRGKA